MKKAPKAKSSENPVVEPTSPDSHKLNPAKTVLIKIDAVIIKERMRKSSPAEIADLVTSISQIGLLQPIVVTKSNRLVSGLHRLAACEELGWKTIPALAIADDSEQVEQGEIDENLVRLPLTVLERCEHHKRAKEIAEERESSDAGKGDGPRNNFAESYTEGAARRSDVSRRSVQHEIQIATLIPREVRDLLRDTPVADRKNDLLRLSKYSAEDQHEIAIIFQSITAQTLDAALRIFAERLEPEERLKLSTGAHARRLKGLLEFASTGMVLEELSDQAEISFLMERYRGKETHIYRTLNSVLQHFDISGMNSSSHHAATVGDLHSKPTKTSNSTYPKTTETSVNILNLDSADNPSPDQPFDYSSLPLFSEQSLDTQQ